MRSRPHIHGTPACQLPRMCKAKAPVPSRNSQCVLPDAPFCTPRHVIIPSSPKNDARRVGGTEHVPRRVREARLLLRRRVWWTVGCRRGYGHRQRGEAHSAVVGATLRTIVLAPLNIIDTFSRGQRVRPCSIRGAPRTVLPNVVSFGTANGRRGRCRCSGHSLKAVCDRAMLPVTASRGCRKCSTWPCRLVRADLSRMGEPQSPMLSTCSHRPILFPCLESVDVFPWVAFGVLEAGVSGGSRRFDLKLSTITMNSLPRMPSLVPQPSFQCMLRTSKPGEGRRARFAEFGVCAEAWERSGGVWKRKGCQRSLRCSGGRG